MFSVFNEYIVHGVNKDCTGLSKHLDFLHIVHAWGFNNIVKSICFREMNTWASLSSFHTYKVCVDISYLQKHYK